MDHSTKAYAKEKVDYMIANIGYPQWITDVTILENRYKGQTSQFCHLTCLQQIELTSNFYKLGSY